MRHLFLGVIFCAIAGAAAHAAEPDYNELNRAGYQDVSKLLASMTPEQRAAFMKKAEAQQKQLENLTPEQRQRLEAQLKQAHNTMHVEKLDPNKIDPNAVKSVPEQQRDLAEYNYQQRHLRNPPTASGGR